uniref:NADH dehydrogenase (Ubiquinone) 1 alpha subcomplex 9 n=1 Tax=Kwoniella dejecticola CBS 10117 TaxID=1296121 RepID=A0A1A6ACU1_9TREE|nr:NADH dehydrogenase (ubiquinone) 1 alpha subcomplex 9 [Kwoniella dejecticola CBS 10117]OBR87863.1 NADH dehydrogenase (ubiquinone) 1 alpha subcomplex 9 [Kwoniella dejecticola CBS 10117]
MKNQKLTKEANYDQSAHQLVVTSSPDPSHTPKPIIKYGPPTGGRSSDSGHTVTVFGCTGFLGRYLVQKLARQGTQVIVPYRDEDEKRPLKIMGDLGQIVPMEWDARNPDQIAECVKRSDVVYNLVGRDWETRNFKYEDVNVKAAGLIAEVSAAVNVPRLVHVSHLNAHPDSASAFYRSKYHGERAVRDAFPTATIVRPAQLYGYEDWLLNAIAQYPILFKLNEGKTKILPVHVMDVAAALDLMLNAPVTSVASTFALPGPVLHTFNSLASLVSSITLNPTSTAPTVPKQVAKLVATALNRGIWWPTISPDEIERKYIDDLGVEAFSTPNAEKVKSGWEEAYVTQTKGIDGEEVKSWKELDMIPDPIEEHAIKYLRRYRAATNYDIPVETGRHKPPKPYHVLP